MKVHSGKVDDKPSNETFKFKARLTALNLCYKT
jgi:hypothetical protein